EDACRADSFTYRRRIGQNDAGGPARCMRASILALLVCACLGSLSIVHTSARLRSPDSSPELSQSAQPAAVASGAPALRQVLDRYCVTCHNERLHTAGLALDSVDPSTPAVNPELWER